MATVKVLDPITRIEGHLKIEIAVDTVDGVQQVVDAHATGTLFRGFEILLKNRPPQDAPHITQRICGVCPVSHGMAAVKALEAAAKFTVPENARIMRNLVLGANFVQSHILHFYHLALMDFVAGPGLPPWEPRGAADLRITGADAQNLINNYVAALEMRRKAHEMGALFGGRLPHPPTYIPGGFTTTPRADRITKFRAYLNELLPFIENVWIPDVAIVAGYYPEYYEIGAGASNLLAFGVFDLNASGSSMLLRRGHAISGVGGIKAVDVAKITESVTHSWYADNVEGRNPVLGDTVPKYPKADAYSWLKAPRYANLPYETGPLARMWVNGDYSRGVSVMDRHWARVLEARKVGQAMLSWLSQLQSGGAVYSRYTPPNSASGIGLTEAPRGALGHWAQISSGLLSRYQVITPTCWNASPRDKYNVPGPIEQALIGTPISDPSDPVEVVRVIHSFDPCLSCAVHVMRPGEDVRVVSMNPTAPKV